MNSKIKNIIIFSVIGLALVLIYIFFIKKTPEDASLIIPAPSASSAESSISENSDESINAGADFLSLLLSVKNIKLNDAILSDPAFSSLKDSSIILFQEGNEGRTNPFAPIGYEALLFTIPPTDVAQTGGGANPN